MKKTIIPSIIAKNQKEFISRINKVKKNSKLIQIDVMDGKFVKNKSLMFDFKLPKIKCKYEAHLMLKNPELWIKKNWKKFNAIIFHIESCEDGKQALNLINLIKNKKRKVGIALNPKTSISKIKPFLNKIDAVLIMSVYPGKYGAKFLPFVLKKINPIKKLKPRLNIEVDGGISLKTIKMVSDSGANSLVSGSFLQKSRKPEDVLEKLKQVINS